jgi:multidrug efflux pump
MDEVTGAVIAIAFGLSAVFVPTAFLGGIAGQFYRQFALTIAVSTLLSAFNSLTLSPALVRAPAPAEGQAERLVRSHLAPHARGVLRRVQPRLRADDARVLAGRRLVRAPPVVGMGLYVALVTLAFVGFRTVPTGFIPAQDKGYLIVAIQLPDGASLERTDAVVRKAGEIILKTEGVRFAVQFAGFSGATRANSSNAGAIFVGPKPFEERTHGPTAEQIRLDLQHRLAEIIDADIFVIAPPPVQGLGTAGGFKALIQDQAGRGFRELQQATDDLVANARKDPAPERRLHDVPRRHAAALRRHRPREGREARRVAGRHLRHAADLPRLRLRERLQPLRPDVPGARQAEGDYRAGEKDIARLRTRNSFGRMVPLGAVLDVQWKSGPDRVVRYNMFPASEVQGDAAPGQSQGTALDEMERPRGQLPTGFGIAWTDIAYQARLAGNTALFIFPLCVLFVFLVHSAEYESWSLPLAIIGIAPVCLPFALLGVWLRGMDNNLVTQIGFVVLIGLAAKNAVLIVEFSKQQEEEGKDRFEAAIEACRLRLRPILMTSFAFILGVLPLARATGTGRRDAPGARDGRLLGMLGVTIMGLFLTPTFYVVLRGLTARRRGAR